MRLLLIFLWSLWLATVVYRFYITERLKYSGYKVYRSALQYSAEHGYDFANGDWRNFYYNLHRLTGYLSIMGLRPIAFVMTDSGPGIAFSNTEDMKEHLTVSMESMIYKEISLESISEAVCYSFDSIKGENYEEG